MSLPQRMAKNARRRFGQSAELVLARCDEGYSWSVRVKGRVVLEAVDKKRRAAQLLLHDALSGLARAADSRVGGLHVAVNDNAYGGAL